MTWRPFGPQKLRYKLSAHRQGKGFFNLKKSDFREGEKERERSWSVRDYAIIIWGGGGSKISKVGLKIKLHPP